MTRFDHLKILPGFMTPAGCWSLLPWYGLPTVGWRAAFSNPMAAPAAG